MGGIDLDAARAARLEALDERYFTFKAERFELPAECPFECIEAATRLGGGDNEALGDFMRGLLGDEGYDRFRAHRPSIADLEFLVESLLVEYGVQGEGEGGDESGKPRP